MKLAYNTTWTQPPKLYAHGPDMVEMAAALWDSNHLARVKFTQKVTTDVDMMVGHCNGSAAHGSLVTSSGLTDFSLVPNAVPIEASFSRPRPKVKVAGNNLKRFEIEATGLAELMDTLAVAAGFVFYAADDGRHGMSKDNNHYLIEVENLVGGTADWLELRLVAQREARGLVVTKFEFKFPHQSPGRLTCAGTR